MLSAGHCPLRRGGRAGSRADGQGSKLATCIATHATQRRLNSCASTPAACYPPLQVPGAMQELLRAYLRQFRGKRSAALEALAAEARQRDLEAARFDVFLDLFMLVLNSSFVAWGAYSVWMTLGEPFPMVEATGRGAAADIALCNLLRAAYCLPAALTLIIVPRVWEVIVELNASVQGYFQARRNMKN
jgi:hypothetical protein